MADEPRTDDLLERLLKSASPEAYLKEQLLDEKSFAYYATELLDEKGLTKADVIREAGLGQTYGYELLSGRKRTPERDKVIMLAFGLHADLTQTQRLLRRAGCSELWSKSERDAIIIHCISRGLTRQQTDDELYRLGYETLVAAEG